MGILPPTIGGRGFHFSSGRGTGRGEVSKNRSGAGSGRNTTYNPHVRKRRSAKRHFSAFNFFLLVFISHQICNWWTFGVN